MIVIAVANSKGGVGKTTLTAALAVEAAKTSPRVAVYDADKGQGSITFWLKSRKHAENPSVFEGADTVADAIDALRHDSWDYVFIDGPPQSLLTTQELIDVADFVIVPIRPSSIDLAATQDAIELVRDAKAAYIIVINGARTKNSKLADAARGFLFNHGLPIYEHAIVQRDSYASAMATGRTGPERDKEAAAEITALWDQIKPLAIAAAKAKARR